MRHDTQDNIDSLIVTWCQLVNATSDISGGDDTDCASVICPAACPGDVNGDGFTIVTDLLTMLAAWGACP